MSITMFRTPPKHQRNLERLNDEYDSKAGVEAYAHNAERPAVRSVS